MNREMAEIIRNQQPRPLVTFHDNTLFTGPAVVSILSRNNDGGIVVPHSPRLQLDAGPHSIGPIVRGLVASSGKC